MLATAPRINASSTNSIRKLARTSLPRSPGFALRASPLTGVSSTACMRPQYRPGDGRRQTSQGSGHACLGDPVAQLGFDETVDVTVEHPVWVADFKVRAMILHHLVGSKDVRADLGPEVDSLAFSADVLELFLTLCALELC